MSRVLLVLSPSEYQTKRFASAVGCVRSSTINPLSNSGPIKRRSPVKIRSIIDPTFLQLSFTASVSRVARYCLDNSIERNISDFVSLKHIVCLTSSHRRSSETSPQSCLASEPKQIDVVRPSSSEVTKPESFRA